MSTATARSTQPTPTLHLAFDLGNRIWTLAFATSIAHAPRRRTMQARDLTQLDAEIAAAKARFGLAADAPVVSCYEAGRDGFWLHRALTAGCITSHVVDSANIKANRRARPAKSDRLDAGCSEGAARRRAALARMECLWCLARRVRGTRPSQHG